MRPERAVVTVVCVLVAGSVAVSQQEETVFVQGGTFLMGTPASAIPDLKRTYAVSFPGVFEDEAPAHTVTLGDFRMDRYEVTNGRFATFVAAQPEWGAARVSRTLHNGHYLEHWLDNGPPESLVRHPVVNVTWHAAQAFCLWSKGRLPTEAEWEYAARARGDGEFTWGEALPSPDRANYGASRVNGTTAVGSYPPNALGLHDMAGNVWEFTLDAWAGYSATAQTQPVAGGEPPRDPAVVQGRRALRGASFGGGVVNLRTRWRDSHEVTNAVAFVGFRCAYPARS